MGSTQDTIFKHRGYTVRHWTPKDRNFVPQIAETCLKLYGLELVEKDQEVIEMEESFLKDGEFWVVVDDSTGKLVGTCGYHELPIDDSTDEDQDMIIGSMSCSVEIRKLYLLPEARGKKLGRTLLTVSLALQLSYSSIKRSILIMSCMSYTEEL